MKDSHSDLDSRMRMAAFEQVKKLSTIYTHIPAKEISKGFTFRGNNISLLSRPRGIFKPKEMKFLLSIKTTIPRPGRNPWYEDQIDAHKQILEGETEHISYNFMKKGGPEARDNQLLREASENQIPIIYFLGIAPGQYQAIVPAFIGEWDRNVQKVKVFFGKSNQMGMVPPETSEERRYTLHMVKQRVHQGRFRESILTAYRERCALSGIPERRLLDAAHIIPDADTEFGQPVIPNGLLLSKIHHAAFDGHLIGIDPDYRIHVSKRLLDQDDGPTFEALKQLGGKKLRLPKRIQDYPDRERLEIRYNEFKAMG